LHINTVIKHGVDWLPELSKILLGFGAHTHTWKGAREQKKNRNTTGTTSVSGLERNRAQWSTCNESTEEPTYSVLFKYKTKTCLAWHETINL